MFVRGVAELSEAYVSVQRLQSFLESDEMITNRDDSPAANDAAISVTNLTANWTVTKKMPVKAETIEEIGLKTNEQWSERHDTLNAINVTIRKGALVGIVGAVGSGEPFARFSRLVNLFCVFFC